MSGSYRACNMLYGGQIKTYLSKGCRGEAASHDERIIDIFDVYVFKILICGVYDLRGKRDEVGSRQQIEGFLCV